ncbi:hypothetical protein C8Q77DRAFT_685650 [Trametes polyzona]|nr:hypothetical protein C8Q77DRAFT_685650 [Trametes polyzona]
MATIRVGKESMHNDVSGGGVPAGLVDRQGLRICPKALPASSPGCSTWSLGLCRLQGPRAPTAAALVDGRGMVLPRSGTRYGWPLFLAPALGGSAQAPRGRCLFDVWSPLTRVRVLDEELERALSWTTVHTSAVRSGPTCHTGFWGFEGGRARGFGEHRAVRGGEWRGHVRITYGLLVKRVCCNSMRVWPHRTPRWVRREPCVRGAIAAARVSNVMPLLRRCLHRDRHAITLIMKASEFRA